jgi:hypothetical protein
MQIVKNTQYKTVIEQINTWPADERLALAHEILRTLRPELSGGKRREGTLHIALGLLATGEPAPTDEIVQQWIRERREERYG